MTLTNLADLGTFIASVANIGLVIFALVQIMLLRRQVGLAEHQTDAAVKTVEVAHESVEATRAAVLETARVRIDEQAPRVIALMEAPQWPPLVDRHRSSMPGGGEPRLFDPGSLRRTSVPTHDGHFVFPRDQGWFMWFKVRGVLINDGRSTARVQMGGEYVFVEGMSPLVPAAGEIKVPACIGVPIGTTAEYLLRSGEVAMFEWAFGRNLAEFADAYQHQDPPNPYATGFQTISVTDGFEHGIIDSIFVEAVIRPIHPVPGTMGQWRIPADVKDVDMGVTVYPTHRTYRSEGWKGVEPPWTELYRAFDEPEARRRIEGAS
jgi:hypothetical protein